MLTISEPMKGTGCAQYFLHKGIERYYLNSQESPGIWHGKGAKALGLEGEVKKADFVNLLSGFEPVTGRSLVQNAGSPDRQTCWDFTFSTPKSVSVLWALANEGGRVRIEKAHKEAVLAVLDFAEKYFGISRIGRGGDTHVHADLAWALFGHGASRAEDPQLHTHATLVNVAVRENGTTGTLVTKELFRHKIALGNLFQAELANRLVQDLGVKIEPARVGFHIAGVPHAVCKAFSQRRAQIEAAMEQRGTVGGVAAKEAAIETRPNKREVMREQLFSAWSKKARTLGWGEKQVAELLSVTHAPATNVEETLSDGIHKSYPRRPKSSPKLLRDAARIGLRSGATMPQILAAVNRANERGLLSLEWKRLFRDAPPWNPASKVKVPFVSLNLNKHKKWGKIHSEARIPGALIQVRQKKLFAKAPAWNPASKLELPAIKIWHGKFATKVLKATARIKDSEYRDVTQKSCNYRPPYKKIPQSQYQ